MGRVSDCSAALRRSWPLSGELECKNPTLYSITRPKDTKQLGAPAGVSSAPMLQLTVPLTAGSEWPVDTAGVDSHRVDSLLLSFRFISPHSSSSFLKYCVFQVLVVVFSLPLTDTGMFFLEGGLVLVYTTLCTKTCPQQRAGTQQLRVE